MDSFVKNMHIFVAIVETGSMSSAAKQLNLSNSAVSQQVNKLERKLNTKLLNRNTRQLTCTEAGEIYYQSCKETISTWCHAQQKLNLLKGTLQGELRVAAPVGFSSCGLLSPPLQELLRSYHHLNVRLFIQDENFDLISNRIDLMLKVKIGRLPDSNFIARKLADWNTALVVSPDYLKSMGIDKDDIENIDVINQLDLLVHENTRINELNLRMESINLEHLLAAKERLVVNNMQALIQFTKDGLGMALLPAPEIAKELQDGSLVQLMKNWSLPQISIYAVTTARCEQSAKVRVAIDILRNSLKSFDNG